MSMVYYCVRCRRKVEVNYEYPGVKCPYCGYRILVKERPTFIKRVKAE